jgi:hypothetical protein
MCYSRPNSRLCSNGASDCALIPERICWDNPGTKIPRFVALFSGVSGVRTIESSKILERAMGIEPTSEPWEATVCSHQCKEIPEFQLLLRPETEFFTGWAQVLVHCAVGSR